MKTVLWIVLLTVVAAIVVGAQLDRQARISTEIAQYVPPPSRAFAQGHLTAQALRAGNHEEALSQARRLVARRPMPAEHLRMLALAQAMAGDQSASIITLQAAARRGWRDLAVQEAMLRLAIENEDRGESVRRYAALSAALQTDDAVLRELGPAALATSNARSDFAAILAPARRWHRLFLSRGVRTLPVHIADEVIGKAVERGANFECSDLRQAQRIIADKTKAKQLGIVTIVSRQC